MYFNLQVKREEEKDGGGEEDLLVVPPPAIIDVTNLILQLLKRERERRETQKLTYSLKSLIIC